MDNLHPYLRITILSLIISPLVWVFWRLDFSATGATVITASMYAILLTVAFMLYNYLVGPDKNGDKPKNKLHVHSYSKPILSMYISFGTRDIIYECSCGKRRVERIYRSFGAAFPIPTDSVEWSDFKKIADGASFYRLGNSRLVMLDEYLPRESRSIFTV